MRPRWRLTAAWLVLGLALAGCTDSGGPAKPLPPPPAGEAPTGVSRGNKAPDIEGEDADGRPFKLSDYRGKVVLLDFWGNW